MTTSFFTPVPNPDSVVHRRSRGSIMTTRAHPARRVECGKRILAMLTRHRPASVVVAKVRELLSAQGQHALLFAWLYGGLHVLTHSNAVQIVSVDSFPPLHVVVQSPLELRTSLRDVCTYMLIWGYHIWTFDLGHHIISKPDHPPRVGIVNRYHG